MAERTYRLAVSIDEKGQLRMKTEGKNMPLSEAVTYVETWLNVVKDKMKQDLGKEFKSESY